MELPLIKLQNQEKLWDNWAHHVFDFLKLVDMGQIMPIVSEYRDKPEFEELKQYINSADFKKLVHDFESLKEFKELVTYFHDRGYKIETVLDIINSEVDSIKTKKDTKNKKYNFGNEMTNFIHEIVEVLPTNKFKNLLMKKFHSDEEIDILFERLTSNKFKDIIRRMLANPKFLKIKKLLEGYGFDFQRLSALADSVVGDFFDGINRNVVQSSSSK